MPRPPESPEVRQSKALAYILRHGAEKEGIHIRSDGLVQLDHVVGKELYSDILTTARAAEGEEPGG